MTAGGPGPEGTIRVGRRLEWSLVAVALSAFVALVWYGRQRGVYWGGDDADYMLLARSLRDLRYDDLFYVSPVPHAQYPPGFPALLAVWGSLAGESIRSYVVLNLVLGASALLLAYALIRRWAGRPIALMCVFVLAVNPHLVHLAGSVLSDAPFLLLLCAVLWLADARDPHPRRLIAAAVVAGAATFVRTIGLVLLLGLILHSLLERRFRVAALQILVGIGPLTIWGVRTQRAAADAVQTYGQAVRTYSGSYDAFGSGDLFLVERIGVLVSKAAAYVGSVVPDLFAFPLVRAVWLENVAWALIWIPALAVGILGFSRRRPILIILAAYVAVLVVWPWVDVRFLAPLLPPLLAMLLLGIERLARRLLPHHGFAVAALLATVMFASGGIRSVAEASCDESILSETPDCVPPPRLAFGSAVRFADDYFGEGEVVLSPMAEVLFFQTGIRSVPWEVVREMSPEEFRRYADATRLRGVILAELYDDEIAANGRLLRRICPDLELEAMFEPGTMVFSVRDERGSGSEAVDAGSACSLVDIFLTR